MATHKKYDLAVAVDSYTDRDGKKKNKYQNIGSVMQKDDGSEFILLDRTFNPAGVPNPENRSTIIVSKFEPRQQANGAQNGYQAPQQQQRSASAPQHQPAPAGGEMDDFDDDIPF